MNTSTDCKHIHTAVTIDTCTYHIISITTVLYIISSHHYLLSKYHDGYLLLTYSLPTRIRSCNPPPPYPGRLSPSYGNISLHTASAPRTEIEIISPVHTGCRNVLARPRDKHASTSTLLVHTWESIASFSLKRDVVSVTPHFSSSSL